MCKPFNYYIKVLNCFPAFAFVRMSFTCAFLGADVHDMAIPFVVPMGTVEQIVTDIVGMDTNGNTVLTSVIPGTGLLAGCVHAFVSAGQWTVGEIVLHKERRDAQSFRTLEVGRGTLLSGCHGSQYGKPFTHKGDSWMTERELPTIGWTCAGSLEEVRASI